VARRIALGVVLLAAAAALCVHALGALSGGAEPVGTPASATGAVYQCAMHPQIVSDRPGVCPICRMKLERVDPQPAAAAAEAAPAAPEGRRRIVGYRHPMRPDVTSPVPAKDEMGMAYTPIYEDETGAAVSAVPGHAPFVLSTERQQLIGVTRGKVERLPLEVEIRAVGHVAYDPMLYQAIVEYREALRSREEVAHSPLTEAHTGAEAIVSGARLKLLQQGLSEAQIRELSARSGDPVDLLLPGDSSWVYVQLYEYEAPIVAPGQRMRITTPAYPGRTFSGKVVAVDPILDPATRTVRVRGRVAAAGATLRPLSFVDVAIRVPLGERLAVPREAVLDTGEHRIVFVVKGEGSFEPRAVELGRQAGGFYEVLSGLDAGDEVVTSANFLIDSESRFRSALASFGSAGNAPHAR
jgi:Cu(I)/Ag(I) efflux system membrane fusion protein